MGWELNVLVLETDDALGVKVQEGGAQIRIKTLLMWQCSKCVSK